MVIYKTTNKINGKFYIGKDEKNNPNYLGSGLILQKAIKKYGIENFIKEILEICNNKEELCEREIYWINELNSIRPNGYNIAKGGLGGDTFTYNPNKENIRKKLSISTSNKIWTDDSKQKASNTRKKMLNGQLPKNTKNKIKETLLNKNLPDNKKQNDIINYYLDPWNQLKDLYKIFGITSKMLDYILKLNNIDKIKRYSYQTPRFTLDTELNIKNDYLSGVSLNDLNKKYDLGKKVIIDILFKHNVQLKQSGFKKGEKKTPEMIKKIQISKKSLINDDLIEEILLYLSNTKNVLKCSEHFNIKYSRLKSFLKTKNIKIDGRKRT